MSYVVIYLVNCLKLEKSCLKIHFQFCSFQKRLKKQFFGAKYNFFVNVARQKFWTYPKLAGTPCNTIRRRERKDLWRLSMHSSHWFSSNRRVVYLWHDHLLSPIGLSRQKTVMYSIKKFLFFKPPFFWLLLKIFYLQSVPVRFRTPQKNFQAKIRFFTNMYFRSLKLRFSHFLLTAKKKCLFLCNLHYVVIYLVNIKTIA